MFHFGKSAFLLLTGLAICGAATQASAQSPRRADDCILDNCRDRMDAPRNNRRDFDRPYGRDRSSGDRRGGGGESRGSSPGRFDFYVLSLSWSPSFCGSEAGRRSREQCAIGARNTFVVHGLWPQFERGFPSYCDDRNPPRFSLDQARGIFPEEGLARYQWRKHGSCSGLSPAAYYQTVGRARDMVAIPAEYRTPRGPITANPMDIERAFIAANRNLRPGMLAVACRRGELQEVRVCLSKDVRQFVPCPDVARSACRIGSVRVPPPR